MRGDDRQGGARARVWIGPWSFAGVLLFAGICASAAFVWTIERSPGASVAQEPGRVRDPDPSWGNRARSLLVRGRYEELAEAARGRMQRAPHDGEAWQFAAFALEAMAELPGLDAMEHRANAQSVWDELLERSRPRGGRSAFRNPDYFAGWALTGLGRPFAARERFGRFAAFFTSRVDMRSDPYNTACYLALAGDFEGANAAWTEAARRRRIDVVWAMTDPDLDAIREDLSFRVWLLYATEMSRRDERNRRDRQRSSGGI